MGTTETIHVERVLTGSAELTGSEIEALLEAAYLLTATGERLSDEATAGLRAVAAELRDGSMTDGEFATLVARFAAPGDAAARRARIAATCGRLHRSTARELAYKVAFAMSLCDLDAYDDETHGEGDLAEVFGIDDARADALAAEVYEALDTDLDRDSEHPRAATLPPTRDPFG